MPIGRAALNISKRALSGALSATLRHPAPLIAGAAVAGIAASGAFDGTYDSIVNEGLLGESGATQKLMTGALGGAIQDAVSSTATRQKLNFLRNNYVNGGNTPSPYNAVSGDIVFGLYNMRVGR